MRACTINKKKKNFGKHRVGMSISGRYNSCHFSEIREVIHRMDGAFFHLEAIGRFAIAEKQELGLKGGMVTEGLL